jgi:hypothetical protein
MSGQYDRNNEGRNNGPVRASRRQDADQIEGEASVTVPGPGSRHGPGADDDRPNGRTMDVQLLYTNLSPSERVAADALLLLRNQ